jgi:phosphomannomutase/phosphoglucomutase
MNPHIFREYDIRGVADRDLTDDLARDLGRALGTFQKRAGRRRIALGQDCRLSSPRLHRELLGGLLEAGMQVTDIGIGATPMMYFAVFHLDLEGGVQITGSHNPPGDNGFKMMKGKASLFGPDILELRAMIERRDFDLSLDGTVTSLDLMSAYAGFIRGNVSVARKDIRFAIDAGNGAGGPQALAAMQAAGLSPVALLCEMDGNFPVHHPDPSDPHTLELLRDTVLSQGLELGIAFDGDADRIGVIDARGDIIWGDKLLIVLSRALLLDHPGAAVLGEVKCSQTLYDDIAQHGGRPILWKTGHSLIKAKMKEEGALLAGEMSGHVFFADRFFGFDDAVYAALRLLEIVAASDRRSTSCWPTCPSRSPRPSCAWTARTARSSGWSPRCSSASASPTRWWRWTVPASSSTGAGAWCAPPTRSPCSSCASRRSPRHGSRRSAARWRTRSPPSARLAEAQSPLARSPLLGGGL